MFLFTQNYEQDAINSYAPFVVAPIRAQPALAASELDDFGVGVFGQGTVTFSDRLDLTAGARVDYENKSATLETLLRPGDRACAPRSTPRRASRTSRRRCRAGVPRCSPTRRSMRRSAAATRPAGSTRRLAAGSEAYGEEHTWNFEGGVKTLWAERPRLGQRRGLLHRLGRPAAERARTRPCPAQFYIANVGGAISKGVELEISARAAPGPRPVHRASATRTRGSATAASRAASTSRATRSRTRPTTRPAPACSTRARSARATLHGRADVGVLRRVPVRRPEHARPGRAIRSSTSGSAATRPAF